MSSSISQSGVLLSPAFSWPRALVRSLFGVATRSEVIDGLRWSWIEAGPADGEPIILLHGFAGNKDNWLFLLPILARRYRVICPDLPGFGDSGRAASGGYSIGEQARRVVRFIESKGMGPCHLGGNSMGGFIALTIALERPDLPLSLLLLNNAGVDGAQRTLAQQAITQGRYPFEVRNAGDVNALLRLLFHRPPFVPWPVRRLIARKLGGRRPFEERIFRDIVPDAIERPLNDKLHKVLVPTLVLWGRSDRLLHVSAGEVEHARIARSELVILDRAGHVPMIERPLRTARAILSFLSRCGDAAA